MPTDVRFRTPRLTGRHPAPDVADLYETLFGRDGASMLERNIQDWSRHRVAPWTLAHAGQDVGIGGFLIGFGNDGLELSFHFIERVWGLGLASEFVTAAIDHATDILNADRFFAVVGNGGAASVRVLEKAGFRFAKDDGDRRIMYLRRTP